MQWKNPKTGDERIVRKFLLIPVRINYETRWLEFASILQVYDEHWGIWANRKWVTAHEST